MRLKNECRAVTVLSQPPSVQSIAPRDSVRWEKPAVGWCKLNTDGLVRGEIGLASFGGVIQSDQGSWIVGFSKGIGVCSVLDAELWGIYEGLLTAWSVSIQQLVVEVDSIDAIRVIHQGLAGFISLSIVAYIVQLVRRSWSVQFQHIPREGNRLADSIAKRATFDDLVCRRFLSIPEGMMELVQMDCLPRN
ncbi:hypothetical protein GQ457_16G012460 [Hibiscus cannabinus]